LDGLQELADVEASVYQPQLEGRKGHENDGAATIKLHRAHELPLGVEEEAFLRRVTQEFVQPLQDLRGGEDEVSEAFQNEGTQGIGSASLVFKYE
jgi:hypothetical protein